MKTILLLTLYTLCKSGDTVWLKRGQPKDGSVWQNLHFSWLYCLVQSVLLFALPPYGPLHFEWAMLLWPALFALFFVSRVISTVKAANEGPMSLTQIIISFNTLFPVVAGVLFWDERLSWMQLAGLALFCVALPLFNSGSYSDGGARRKLTLRWLVYSVLALLFSGFAVSCTKMYSARFDGAYIKEYLITYSAVAAVGLTPVVLWMYLRRRADTVMSRSRVMNTAAAALSMDAANIIFMLFIGSFSSALYFPLISVLSVCAVLLAGRVFLRERMNRRVWVGIGLSAVALALLAVG